MFHCNDIDGLMVDWLYGELDESQTQMFSAHVDSCARCTTEQAAFARTRSLFNDVPLQEPSPGLTAMLVREAALSAKPAVEPAQRQSTGGFAAWVARLFQPLMHPAVGALAMLVLVVGVGGVLYMKKGDEHLARPSSSRPVSEASKASGTMSISGDKASAPSAPLGAVEAPSPLPSEASKDDVAEQVLADPAAADEFAAAAQEAKPRTSRSPRVRGGAELEGRLADVLDRKRDDSLKRQAMRKKTAPAKLKKPNAKSKGNVGLSIASNEPELDKDREGFANAAASGSKAEFADGDQAVPGRGMAFGGKDGRDWAMNKDDELIAAYNRKDCLEAARLANDIREKQPEHYKDRTSALTAVKRCRQYVNSERKRRERVAAKAKRVKSKAASPADSPKAKPAKKK